MPKIQSFVWAESAARKRTHAERMKWIEDHVPSTHRKLVRHLLPQFIAAEIVNLPTKEERRAWMDAIPDDADPDWTKALVGQMVKVMWKARAK